MIIEMIAIGLGLTLFAGIITMAIVNQNRAGYQNTGFRLINGKKYLIFGDSHGRDLKDLEDVILIENPDVVINLGDFDQTKTIRQWIDLEKRLREYGICTETVPGNHDEAILNGRRIESGEILKSGKSFDQLNWELNNDPVSKDYIKRLLNQRKISTYLIPGDFGGEYKAIIMHGAYGEDKPNHPPGLGDLWNRLSGSSITIQDIQRDIDEMKYKGYDVMIHGHGHEPSYIYEDIQNPRLKKKYRPGTEDKPGTMGLEYGGCIQFLPKRRHIVDPGAFSNGNYAIIESIFSKDRNRKLPMLTFKKI